MIMGTRNYDEWLTTNQADYQEDDRPVCKKCERHFDSNGSAALTETLCEDCFKEEHLRWTEGKVIRCDICGKIIGTPETDEPFYDMYGDVFCEDCFEDTVLSDLYA